MNLTLPILYLLFSASHTAAAHSSSTATTALLTTPADEISHAPEDDWLASCTFVDGDGSVLIATCEASNKDLEATSLDFNDCLDNSSGVLAYPEYIY